MTKFRLKVMPTPDKYYVAFFVTSCKSFDEVKSKHGATIAAHVARSNELHQKGTLLMAGAFLDHPDKDSPDEPVTTMGIFPTRAAAEEYAKEDPFVLNGLVTKWYIREWDNILR
jgi:uncharacterized protein YciI